MSNIISATGGRSGVFIYPPPHPATQKNNPDFGVRDHRHWIRIEFSKRFPVSRHRDLRSEAISDMFCKFPENRDRHVGNSFQHHEILMASLAKVLSGK